MTTTYYRKRISLYLFVLSLTFLFTTSVKAQLSATFTTTHNQFCSGVDCNYNGPSIMINEIMMAPAPVNGDDVDGSMAGDGGTGTARGEWIELYNPNICQPVDISCYYLGSARTQQLLGTTITNAQEIFILPDNTIIPPGGFCVVRGENAPPVPSQNLVANGGNTVEIVMPHGITGSNICVSGDTRFWFPNAGGWFGFYDENGVPQDAVAWGNINTTSDLDQKIDQCMPTGDCNNTITELGSYNSFVNMNRMTYLNGTVGSNNNSGAKRMPDGGSWGNVQVISTPTMGDCNGPCAQLGSSTCDGTATIHVTGGTPPYTYEWDDAEAQTGQTADSLCAGTYHVKVTDNATPPNVQTFTVTVSDTTLKVTATSQPTICTAQNGEITVNPQTGTAPFSYSIDGGNNFATDPTSTDLDSNTYSVQMKDKYGCIGDTTVKVGFDEYDLTVIATPQDANCGSNNGSIIATPQNGSYPFTYSLNGGTFVNDSTFNNLGANTYTIEAKDQYGCSGDTTAIIGNVDGPTVTAPDDTTICEGSGVPLVGQTGSGATLSWSDGTQQFSNGDLVSPSTTTTYTVTATDANNCTSTDNFIVTVIPQPSPDFSADITGGCAPLTVKFSGNGNTNTDCFWDFGDGTTSTDCGEVVHTYSDSGNYSVKHIISMGSSCIDSLTKTNYIHVEKPVIASFTAQPMIDTLPHSTIQFTNLSSNATKYTWNFGYTGATSNQKNPEHKYPKTSKQYVVTLTASNDYCSDDTSLTILIVLPPIEYKLPNVFTPNGDGTNDVFKFIYHKNIKEVVDLNILNRWGNVVFEASDIDKNNHDADFTWNGKRHNSGAECSDGVYFYTITLKSFDNKEYKEVGFVHLIRNK